MPKKSVKTKIKKTVTKAPKHSNQIYMPRINRIIGQASGAKKMIEANKYCPEILTQLRAVRSAIKSLENAILDSHLNSCVAEALSSNTTQKNKKIAELKEIFARIE